MAFKRSQHRVLLERLQEPRRFIQVLAGPRQTGKTVLARQVMDDYPGPRLYASADAPGLEEQIWLEQQWARARRACKQGGVGLLVLDEVQKVPRWSESVKRFWDEDTADATGLHVLILGSAPLLIQKGLAESLAGRFELTHLPHWSLAEMRSAFGWDLERFLFFGGYPGPAPLVEDEERWRNYICDSLIETTIARDVLLLTRVDKPALLRRLFLLSCRYSAQILAYQKMLGQLQDAGNTTTLAHYLDLLAAAGMVNGLGKYSGQEVRQRASSPKLVVGNTALISATRSDSFRSVREDPQSWGRLVESAVGAHLINRARLDGYTLHYWRHGNFEVDFVLERGRRLLGIEVKSGARTDRLSGMRAFRKAYPTARSLIVGGTGMPLEEFLETAPLEAC